MTTLLRWCVLTVAVWAAAGIVPGVSYDDWQSLLIASLVLGILNAFVKPLLQVVAIPVIVVSFGFFLLVINALLLKFTAWLVPGFHVTGFWPAVGGSLVISLISMLLGYPRHGRRIVVNSSEPFDPGRRGPPPGKGPIIDV
jgi:putative membrane protein